MEVTGYSRGWIQQLARRYNGCGPGALGDRRHQNPGARERALLTEEQQEELREALKKPPPDGGMWNSAKVGEWIGRTTGKVLTQKKQRDWEYLRKLGNSPKVPRPRHKKASKPEREAFKKALDEGLEAQRESHPTAKVELWCEDEHRLGLKPIVRKAWSPIGQRPLVEVHQRYEWSYLYAFAHPKSGEVHWLLLPTVSAEVFSLALSHFASEVGAGKTKRIVLVVDQAGWHTAKNKLEVPEGIHLEEFLPSHSPELQPSERLWPLSNEGVANRRFEEIEELEEVLVERCVALCDQPELIRSYLRYTGGRMLRDERGYSHGLGIKSAGYYKVGFNGSTQ